MYLLFVVQASLLSRSTLILTRIASLSNKDSTIPHNSLSLLNNIPWFCLDQDDLSSCTWEGILHLCKVSSISIRSFYNKYGQTDWQGDSSIPPKKVLWGVHTNATQVLHTLMSMLTPDSSFTRNKMEDFTWITSLTCWTVPTMFTVVPFLSLDLQIFTSLKVQY